MTFKFPKEKNVVISRMAITIDDSKTIEAKVCEEEAGNDMFEDAMAGGNFAAMVKDSRENVDLHQMDIGNLNPGQRVKIELLLIQPLKTDQGAFDFTLPLSYFPVYKEASFIDFNFKSSIKSASHFK